MSIRDLSKKIKGWGSGAISSPKKLPLIPDDVFLGLIIILVAFGSFGLGRLSKIEGAKTPIRIENAPEVTGDTFSRATTTKESATPFTAGGGTGQEASLVGSKNGKKYYYPWCSGANRITEANRIYFSSKTDAEARGYTPSSTCKGL